MMSGLKSEKIIGSKIAIILGLKSTICVSFKILVAKLKKKIRAKAKFYDFFSY